eukprot:365139-Chlamydomonas_euryale.AAC.18
MTSKHTSCSVETTSRCARQRTTSADNAQRCSGGLELRCTILTFAVSSPASCPHNQPRQQRPGCTDPGTPCCGSTWLPSTSRRATSGMSHAAPPSRQPAVKYATHACAVRRPAAAPRFGQTFVHSNS